MGHVGGAALEAWEHGNEPPLDEQDRSAPRSGGEQVNRTHLRRMSLSIQLANDLSGGPSYTFADWPSVAVSTFGAGVYTIWHKDGRFIYVGCLDEG